MRGATRNTSLLLGLCVLCFAAFGCARLTIPAPEAPVKPLAAPVLENSVITLPISLSLKSIAADIGRLLPKSEGHDGPGQENAVAGKIQKFLKRQAPKADNNNFLRNVVLQQQAGKAWDALQGPIKLSNDLYLLLNPQAVSLSPVTEQSDTAKVVIELVAKPKLVANVAPPMTAQPLPALSIAPGLQENGFHIALESELSFDMLGNELTKRLKGRAYSAHGESVLIESVRLSGSGDSVVMAVSVTGAIHGTIYLTGSPAYDESARALSIRNVEYSIETKQVLVKVADWLLHAGLRESLVEHATWPVGEKIDALRDLLSNALNRNLNQHVSLSGKIHTLQPCAVGITATSLKAVFVGDGTAEMSVF